ncbi:U3 snoRNP protein [Malassezia japonica]|uniref:U3 snoRNP protein n=1 Tax=Malassezia japonica TaxID=223818 RepID=A0AAF0F373_9BASI|nr:U3 snoRNP protein [Malassezia japonica]WFD39722.1 U3 snoRNP protein [Malassezia japonica]
MERVQYSLERSLPQLKLLDEQGLLSKDELRSITSQRQGFEARLIRRKADKADFVQYLEFEDDLNSLVQLRARERMREASKQARLPDAEHKARLLPRNFFAKQAASYSAVCIGIFERMVRKFRYDVDAWERYLAWARSRKMRVVAGRVYARALSLHPSHVALWLSAADYELNGNADTTAARALLQRGLRMNPLVDTDAKLAQEAVEQAPSKVRKAKNGGRAVRDPGTLRWSLNEYEQDVLRLWVEYFRMELVFVERLRRRWRVLGLDSGADAAPVLQGEAFASARAAAHTVAPEDAEEDEEAAAAEAEVDDDVPEATLDEQETFATERTAPSAGIQIPEGHKQIMSGSIPLILLANAQKALPTTVQLYLYVALLQLLASFPFYDSVVVRAGGEVISLRTSKDTLGSGDVLRNRLIDGVLAALDTTASAWSEAGQLADAVLKCVHPLLHPFSHGVRKDMEWAALPASLAETELEQNGLLHGASKVHPTFSPPLDALYALAAIPHDLRVAEGGVGTLDPWSVCRPVLFLLQVVSERLVVRTQEAVDDDDDDESVVSEAVSDDGSVGWQATPFLAMLSESGDLPVVIRTLVTLFRKHQSADDEALALAFLATLRFLANPTRAGIDEANLLKYLGRAEDKLLDALLRDGPHLDLAWLAVEQLVRRLDAVDDDETLASLYRDAQRLAETDAMHPGAWALYERIGRQAAERGLPGTDAAAPFAFSWASDGQDAGAARAAWLSMLDACTSATHVAQDTSAPVWGSLVLWLESTHAALPESAALLAPHSARVALWLDFMAWAQHAAHVAPDAPKLARRASKWAWSTLELAVARTGALLASSQLVGTARMYAQALHDDVVQRFFLFAASPEASVAQGEAEEVRSASKDKALRHLFSHSSASVECWLELANREAVLLEVLSPDAYAGLQKRATELYERAIAQTERGSGRLPLDEVWAKYLAFLVESKHDMPAALATFQRALHRLQATEAASAHALETAWHALVDSV